MSRWTRALPLAPSTDREGSDHATVASSPALATWVLVGLLSGIAAGLFLGEICAPLSLVGDVFIGLLRMTVLPYIVFSLVANIGKLSLADSRRLAAVGGVVILGLWATVLLLVFALATGFPDWHAGSFFSTSLVEPPPEKDLLAYFIPTNIFSALSENQIPAVVLLCICVGLALSSVGSRGKVIEPLDILAKVFMRVSGFVARLTPFAVFAMAASIAGTLSLGELARLQAYFLSFTAGAVLLGAVVLPKLVTTCTPFSIREVFAVARVPLLTTLVTGKLLIVLPLLIHQTELLFERHRGKRSNGTAPAVDVLYPVGYSFPHVGKLLDLIFIPFAAWFLGRAMAWHEYPEFLLSGLVSYFGGPILATPYLLDLMQLPHDMFQLFLLAGVYSGRLGDALGVMYLVTFVLLTTAAFTGRIRFAAGPVLKGLGWICVSSLLILGSTRLALNSSLHFIEDRGEAISRLDLIEQPAPSTVLESPSTNPVSLEPGETLLERARRRGAIRVGFNEDKLPFAHRGLDGTLVGFDINMAHALARDLGVRVEFVPFERDTLGEQLREDHFDVVMSGLVGTLERSEQLLHTEPYLDVTLGIVVRDHRARSFQSIESIRRMASPKIGFVDISAGFVERLRFELPDADLIELKANGDFFDKATELDALLISAESGSAFTLLHPEFEVVVPDMPAVSLPLFYAVGAGDNVTRDFLDYWITLKKKDGSIQAYYEHWILGKSRHPRQPRWSVIRDVLGWTR